MTRGAGFWPGGRERSVPPGFPGETGEPDSSATTASAPGRKRKRPIGGWRPRPDLGIPDLGDDPTIEEPRPTSEPDPRPVPRPDPERRSARPEPVARRVPASEPDPEPERRSGRPEPVARRVPASEPRRPEDLAARRQAATDRLAPAERPEPVVRRIPVQERPEQVARRVRVSERPEPSPRRRPGAEGAEELSARRRPAADEPVGPAERFPRRPAAEEPEGPERRHRRPAAEAPVGHEDDEAPARSPFSERPPRKRAVPRAEARVAPAIAASRRAHPAARRLVEVWPGGRAGSLPPDFPGSGAVDKVASEKPPDRILTLADTPSKATPDETRLPKKRRTTGEARTRRAITLPLRPPQRFNNIVGAVYAALADPLAADSAEAREQRAARVREVGLITASTALVALLIYGIFPVRTFLDQRSATADAEERLEKIAEENDRLTTEAERLRDDEEIELRARSDYGWVFPGEESYGVLPPPVATTTTLPEG